MKPHPPSPRLDARAEALEVFRSWHVAYHGTTAGNVRHILDSGGLLRRGEPGGRVSEHNIHVYHWGRLPQSESYTITTDCVAVVIFAIYHRRLEFWRS